MLDMISQKLMGLRVKAAREAKEWTQEQLAKELGLNDRQTVSDIEKGKRAIKSHELLSISDLFDREIEFFIDPFAISGEAQFNWRSDPSVPMDKIEKFEQKSGQWIGLLRWLREQSERKDSALKPTLRLSAQSSYDDAIEQAERLAVELELGPVPAKTLIERVEHELDIPVLFVDTVQATNGESISGAFCRLENLTVILINRNESEARRVFDLAHELFHALSFDALMPDRLESNSFDNRNKGKRTEQLANNFACGLLMPMNSINNFLVKENAGDIKHLCHVAHSLSVAPVALAWRLFNINIIDKDLRDSLAMQKQIPSISGTPKWFSSSFVSMLYEALSKGRLSTRKAAKTIGIEIGELMELFAAYGHSSPFEP